MQGIGNFAESLILSELESPQKKASVKESAWGNIEDVEVSDSFRNQLIESATSDDPTAVAVDIPEEEPEEEPAPSTPMDVEVNPQDIIDRLEGLLHEFKEVLSEMTTTGMLGVNMSNPTDSPKKKKHLPKKKMGRKKKIKLVLKACK